MGSTCSGVCVDTTIDRNNCGACGRVCPATQVCTAGACVNCGTGLSVCGSACVNLQTDSSNCGTCGTVCPTGRACVAGVCSTVALYHGFTCPIAGCSTTSYDTTAPTAMGGRYPYNTGDSNNCRAWKLAATVCTTAPVGYGYTPPTDWTCPTAGGFTDPVFGSFCAVSSQYSCSDCYGACNAACAYTPLSLRNCSGSEVAQP